MQSSSFFRRIPLLMSMALIGPMLAGLATGPAVASAETVVTPVPTAEFVPTTSRSEPFATSSLDLAARGYVEREYFVSGTANVYDWEPGTTNVRVRWPDGPYTTRILVRTPEDPRRFNGSVAVEMMNQTLNYDYAVQWQSSHDYFMRKGWAWVGITFRENSAAALKVFDPVRYASISWANPATDVCARDTEGGLRWDIAAQVGALLKSDVSWNPLAGYGVEKLYLNGQSQTASNLTNFYNGFHARAVTTNGDSIYDGYVRVAGFTFAPFISLSNCFPNQPSSNAIQPRGAPIITVLTETDVNRNSRQPDSDDPALPYRLWEVAGSSHLGAYHMSDVPRVDQVHAAGFLPNAFDCVPGVANDLPLNYIVNKAFDAIDQWARYGVPPARADRFELVGVTGNVIARDEFGNALGGVRTPWVDVPTATYQPRSTPNPNPDPSIRTNCSMFGHKLPFSEERLVELYLNPQLYAAQFIQATQRAREHGFLTNQDAQAIRKRVVPPSWNAN